MKVVSISRDIIGWRLSQFQEISLVAQISEDIIGCLNFKRYHLLSHLKRYLARLNFKRYHCCLNFRIIKLDVFWSDKIIIICMILQIVFWNINTHSTLRQFLFAEPILTFEFKENYIKENLHISDGIELLQIRVLFEIIILTKIRVIS